jgi:ABC-2 type transport system ATP-binding protein
LHSEGRTIVFSTHVLHQAEQLCDRIFLIDHGIKLLDDRIDLIRDRFRQRIVIVDLANTATLEPIAGTRAVTTDDTGRRIELHVDETVDQHDIMRRVLESTDVRGVALREPMLEDIFSQLVGAEAIA